MMALDKRAAIKQRYRTPEKTFYKFSLFFGGIGILLATLPPVNHKKNKTKFLWINRLLLLLNIIFLTTVYVQFGNYFY